MDGLSQAERIKNLAQIWEIGHFSAQALGPLPLAGPSLATLGRDGFALGSG